jgi:phospholipase/carboxylesterase
VSASTPDAQGGAGIDALAHRTRPAAGDPEGALVLFHGRGTDENDLFPLLDALDPARRLVGMTPRGPLRLPPGGAHWYAVRRVGFPDRETFDAVFPRAAGWVDALAAAVGVPLERTVLGGFSQGAVMSYALALGRGRARPAGVLALSGFIPTVEGLELDLGRLEGYPVAIGHGTHDPIISVEFGREARRRLEEARPAVTWRESPMPHAVDPGFIPELREWVAAAVARASRGAAGR